MAVSRPPSRSLAAAAAVGLSAAVWAGGCGKLGFFMDRVPLLLEADVQVPDRCAVVFFVDCMRKSVLDRELHWGRLPYIQKYFVDGGVTVESATTVLPTITYAATASLLTGQAPGRHGILGNQWFDRRTLEHRTYVSIRTYDTVNEDFAAPTIFELLAEAGLDSAVITCPNRRGATIELRNVLSGAVTYWHRNYEQIDWISAIRVAEVGQIVNGGSKRWPTLILVYLPGCDEIMHEHEPDSRRYRHGLRNVDFCIGKVCEALEANGLLERTTLALVTDHGGVEAEHTFDLLRWVERTAGIAATAEPTWPQQGRTQREAVFADKRAVVVADAKRLATIHLAGPEGWQQRPTAYQVQWYHRLLGGMPEAARSLPRMLADDGRVELVAFRDGETYHLLAGGGEAELTRRRPTDQTPMAACRYAYRVVRGRDPLRLGEAGTALADGAFHDDRRWREATAGDRRPDVIGQLGQLFDHGRSGEIVLWAARGWDFEAGSDGDHGGISAAETRVPMCFAGPQLPRGASIPLARNVDLTPTLLGLLGRADVLAGRVTDGEDLSEALRSARPR